MANKYAIVAVYGLGSEKRYEPRWYFDTKADADALAQRLGRAASINSMVNRHPDHERGADHQQWVDSAGVVLKALDPNGDVGVKYEVLTFPSFTPPNESAPANPREQMFRAMRDLG